MLGALIIFSCGARSSEIFAVEPAARSIVLFCLKNADKHDLDQCYTIIRLLFSGGGGGGDSHTKMTGVLVVPFRGQKCRFGSF